jgi:hypothetical protein
MCPPWTLVRDGPIIAPPPPPKAVASGTELHGDPPPRKSGAGHAQRRRGRADRKAGRQAELGGPQRAGSAWGGRSSDAAFVARCCRAQMLRVRVVGGARKRPGQRPVGVRSTK